MKKYTLGIIALLISVVTFFAFNTGEGSEAIALKKELDHGKPTLLSSTWYEYTGPQFPAARRLKSNYARRTTQLSCSAGTVNECAVLLSDDFGPTPSTANMIFDATTGMPASGLGDVVTNHTKGL